MSKNVELVPIILTAVGVLWTISIGLIIYIFKSKDADIKDIKNGMHQIQLDVHSIKKDSEYTGKLVLQLNETVQKQGDFIAAIKINEAKISGRMITVEKEIDIIKRKINL